MELKLFKNLPILLMISTLLAGCTTYEYHETPNVPAARYDAAAAETIDEAELLDVGIVVFEDGLDELEEDTAAYSSVRRSEGVWFANQLKTAMQYSNAWGSVRAMPGNTSVMDVSVTGKILDSNGEMLVLQVEARDATGALWFDETYEQRASSYAYNPEVNSQKDPFHALFVRIANDLFDHRASLSSEQLLTIRNVSKVRFAKDLLPQAYDSFVVETDDGYRLQRIPAANDPMILRIDRIRARNDLFLDVIQDYYRVFNGNMAHPYQEWRKISYREVVYERQLKQQARNEKIAGVASILVGVLAQTSGSRYTRGAGHIGIFGGARLIAAGYAKQSEALIHTSTLRELSNALESELEPSVIDLEDRTITLSGTVEEQFKEWRRILTELLAAESGISVDEAASPVEPTSIDDEASKQSSDGAAIVPMNE